MAKYMHIADNVTSWLHEHGLLTGWALCGARLTAKNCGSRNAPLCPKCYRRSGWTHDKRQP